MTFYFKCEFYDELFIYYYCYLFDTHAPGRSYLPKSGHNSPSNSQIITKLETFVCRNWKTPDEISYQCLHYYGNLIP